MKRFVFLACLALLLLLLSMTLAQAQQGEFAGHEPVSTYKGITLLPWTHSTTSSSVQVLPAAYWPID